MTVHPSTRPRATAKATRGALPEAVLGFDLVLGPAPDGNTRLWLSRFVNATREAWAALELHVVEAEATEAGRYTEEHADLRRRLQDLIRDAMAVDTREPSQLSALRLRGIHVRELIEMHQARIAEMVFEAGWRDIGGEGG